MSDQDQFKQDQQDIHQLYQALDKEQPTAELDELILSAAHEAVAEADIKSSTLVSMKSKRRAWMVPVSVAAVVVVSLSVVLKLSMDPAVLDLETESFEPLLRQQEDAMKVEADSFQAPAMAPGLAKEAKKRATSRVAPAQRQRLEKLDARGMEAVEIQSREKQARKVQANKIQDNKIQPSQLKPNKAKSYSAPVSSLPATAGQQMEKPSAADMAAGAIAIQSMAEKAQAPAEEWVSELLVLLDQGDSQRLQQQLIQFRLQYPVYRLPQRLADWEKRMTINPQGRPASRNE